MNQRISLLAFVCAIAAVSTTEAQTYLTEQYEQLASLKNLATDIHPDTVLTGEATYGQAIAITGKTPYVVHVRVKSDGWTGRIGIINEDDHIDIADTQNEWTLIDAVIRPQYTWRTSSYATPFLIQPSDGFSSGTLQIDDLEIYAGNSGTTIGSSTALAAVQVGAGSNWKPLHEVNVWRIGFTETSPSVFSQIDTSLVSLLGAPFITRTFEGSKLCAVYLPGDVTKVNATGTFDYRDHYGYPLYHGLDFICQRLDPTTGKFQYLDSEESLTAGAYVIQFADNYDGIPITFDCKPLTSPATLADAPFVALGNGDGFTQTIEESDGQIRLYYDEELQQFNRIGSENSCAAALRPFMPYILTTTETSKIVPDGSTGIERLYTARHGESPYAISGSEGGICIGSHISATLPIYNLAGQTLRQVRIEQGDNFIALPAGLYIVANRKVLVR